MKSALFLIFILFSISAKASFVSINTSYDSFSNSKFDEVNSELNGIGLALSFGFESLNIPIQLIYKQASLEGVIKHDGEEQKITQDSSSYGFRATVDLNPRLYLVLGYLNHEIKYKFESLSNYTEAGIKGYYQIKDQESSSLDYGVGYNLMKSETSNLYIEYIIQDYSSLEGSTHSINLGFRYRL